jgi:uncharacterized protein (TIGR02001 family)
VNKLLLPSILLLSTISAPSQAADVSGNIGWNSEYIFRGIPQDDSSPFAGLDVEHRGLYAGTWAADVGDGLEVDLYAGYGGEVEDFSYAIGFTSYLYTDDFDDDYLELNLSGGYKFFTLDVAIGEYDNFSGPTLDYTFVSGTAEYNGFYGVIGVFSQDFDGEFYEAGYGNTLSVGDTDLVDYTFSVIHSSDKLLGGKDDTSFVLSVSKTFDVFSN